MYFYQSGEDDVKLKVIRETRMPANFNSFGKKWLTLTIFPLLHSTYSLFLQSVISLNSRMCQIGW